MATTTTAPKNPYEFSNFKSSQQQWVPYQQAAQIEAGYHKPSEGYAWGVVAKPGQTPMEWRYGPGMVENPAYRRDVQRQAEDAFMRDYSVPFKGLAEPQARDVAKGLMSTYGSNYDALKQFGWLDRWKTPVAGALSPNTNIPGATVPVGGSTHSLAPDIPGGEEELKRKLSMMFNPKMGG